MSETKTLCWSCSNCGKCSWANGVPVEGWTAKETKLKEANNVFTHSYLVSKCPGFEYDGLCSRCIYGRSDVQHPEEWFEFCPEKTEFATFDTCSHFVNKHEIEIEQEYAESVCRQNNIKYDGFVSYVLLWEVLKDIYSTPELTLGVLSNGIRIYGEKNMGYISMTPYKLYKMSEFVCNRFNGYDGQNYSVIYMMKYISRYMCDTIKRGQKAV